MDGKTVGRHLRSFERAFRRLPNNEARRFQLDLARARADHRAELTRVRL
jgi:hypothetical protein